MTCRLKLILPRTECLLVHHHKFSTFSTRTAGLLPAPFVPEKRQLRSIVDKWSLQLPDDYPEPWPYKEKGFNHNYIYYQKSKNRHHQNSKVIIVEGNIGVGKSEFAAELADHLGFLHMPAFKMEDILIDRYGNDLRKFHHLFPKRFRVPDELSFYKKPDDDNTAVMQDTIYECRWEQYLNALAHIFNTGQGVVIERSPYSDFVFANAMRAKNWISPEYFKYYHFARKITLPKLRLTPHLVIYLDCPIWKCLENIKKRGNPDEIANADATYLGVIEDSYKDMLKEAKRYSHILSYDWTTPDRMDFVLDDIYKLNLDFSEWHNSDLLEPWYEIGDDIHYGILRCKLTDKREIHYSAFTNLANLHSEVSELFIYPSDGVHFRHVMMHEVLKDVHTYGWTHKDPKAGWNIWNSRKLTPEMWYEYWWKDYWFVSLHTPDVYFDPHGVQYEPDYLKAHH